MKIIKKFPADINKYDYVFIGAGLSTAVVISQLPANKKILVVEKRNTIAGNIYDYSKNNILVHLYGPHIFHTSDEEVYKFLKQYTDFNSYRNVVEANIDGTLIALPININSIKLLFPNEADEFIKYLKNRFPNQEKITILELSQIDKFRHIYKDIYNKVFVSYTVKMWDKKVEDLDVSVFSRVPIYMSERNTYFTDPYEGLPTKGYTTMVENMLKGKDVDVLLNTNIKECLQIKDSKIYINKQEYNKPVINCAPIDEIFDYKYGKLPYRSLNIKFEELNVPHFQKTAVVNYPQDPTLTRISEYKNFYPELKNEENTIISKEYPGAFNENDAVFNERYYPIPNDTSREQYNNYVEESKKVKNLYNLGRLATYQYINMDQAVRKALDFVKELNK